MTALNWREVDEIRLHNAVLPHPTQFSETAAVLTNVRVAVDGAFLHIDPRPVSDGPTIDEVAVFVVPASAVEVIRYRVRGSSPQFFAWTDL